MKIAVLAVAAFVVLATPAVAKPYPKMISEKQLTDAIRQNLQYHSPQYFVPLDQAYPDAGVRDLVRAGLLETVSTTNDCFLRWRLHVTRKGQSIAWARGWSVYRDGLTIQVGNLRYVPGSAKVLRSLGRPYAVRFEFQYVPDSNANALLSIGPARDWRTGDGLTLADSGHVYVRTAPLFYNSARGWFLLGFRYDLRGKKLERMRNNTWTC